MRKQRGFVLAMAAAVVLVLVLMSTAAGAGVSMRVSTDSSGAQANYGSYISSVSSDGRYVAFDSDAYNLIAGDTNGLRDVFVKDISNGQITRASTSSVGAQQYGERPSISASGQQVAFQSAASGLVSGDTNNAVDVFVKDMGTGATTRVSPNGGTMPSISADGRYVAFQSSNRAFITDRQTGVTSQVSTSDNWNPSPSVSGDGRYVAYAGGSGDIYVKDRQTGVTVKVHSETWCTAEWESCSASQPEISADGRYVVYQTADGGEGNWTSGEIKDLVGGSITVLPGVFDCSGGYSGPSVSSNGRYVTYDVGSCFVHDVTVWDRTAGTTTTLASDTSWSNNGDSFVINPAISGDGSRVAFASDASNLIAGDTNAFSDIFLATVYEPAPPADTTAPVISNIQPTGTLNSSSATVSAYFSDADPSSGIDVASASLTVSGGTVSDCVATASGITCTASGLADGEHTINVSVADNEGNTGAGSGSFTVDTCQPAKPALGISSMVPSWASYADYQAGLLTVSLSISNAGPGNAYGLGLVGAVNTMGVTTASGIPGPVGNVDAGTSQSVGVKYQVPAGVSAFKSSIYATAADSCDEIYSYPGPMPGA